MNADKLRDFYLQVKLDYGMSLEAESEEEAREIVKNMFEEQHNIALEEHEIISDFNRNENILQSLLEEILYMADNIDEQGFSNEKIKNSVKENIRYIMYMTKGE